MFHLVTHGTCNIRWQWRKLHRAPTLLIIIVIIIIIIIVIIVFEKRLLAEVGSGHAGRGIFIIGGRTGGKPEEGKRVDG